jgi:hypothetical protein
MVAIVIEAIGSRKALIAEQIKLGCAPSREFDAIVSQGIRNATLTPSSTVAMTCTSPFLIMAVGSSEAVRHRIS